MLPIRNKKAEPFIPKKLWVFSTTVDNRDILCFRITHPAARGNELKNNELENNQNLIANTIKKVFPTDLYQKDISNISDSSLQSSVKVK